MAYTDTITEIRQEGDTLRAHVEIRGDTPIARDEGDNPIFDRRGWWVSVPVQVGDTTDALEARMVEAVRAKLEPALALANEIEKHVAELKTRREGKPLETTRR